MLELLDSGPSVDDMSSLALKLRFLKKKVKAWTRDRALQLKKEYMQVVEDISALLSSYPLGIMSLEDDASLRALRDRKFKMLSHETLTWKLKSRTKWAELGDANTKYFHSIASTHRNHNSIWAL